jgi:hypothetical protein
VEHALSNVTIIRKIVALILAPSFLFHLSFLFPFANHITEQMCRATESMLHMFSFRSSAAIVEFVPSRLPGLISSFS